MSMLDILAISVVVVIFGQLWLVTNARRRIDRQIRDASAAAAKKKAQLIEAEYEKQTRRSK